MRVLLIYLLTFIVCDICAQNYTRDAGMRFGDYLFSASYRQFMDDENAAEAIVSAGRRGAIMTLLREYSKPTLGHVSENFYFIYGFGAHAGFRYANRYRVINRVYHLDNYKFMPLLGLDGLLALEYRAPNFPGILSIDFKPFFEYSNIQIFSIYLNSIGFSFKYRF